MPDTSCRRLSFALDLDYVHASRYGDTREGGLINWIARPRSVVTGREVLLLDDILDEGVTLHEIQQWLLAEGAKQVEIAVLTHKKKPLPQPCTPDYPALDDAGPICLWLWPGCGWSVAQRGWYFCRC